MHRLAKLALAAFLVPSVLGAQGEREPRFEPPVGDAEPVFSLLAGHDFERQADAGPDTFRVYEQARGHVQRTWHFRFDGDYALEIADVPGDGNFPELQGYFDPRTGGQVFVHFAFLVTDPAESFNVALAGPGWFSLQPHGIGFWLENRDGMLVHHSDSIPKKLLPLDGYTWYQVDLFYDVDSGSYDLAIFQEGDPQPRVSLSGQPNATAFPGSIVDKFSFIGDRGSDTSAVTYYVDDIVIAADREVRPPAFVAPARRRLFVELFGGPVDDAERAAVLDSPPDLAAQRVFHDAPAAVDRYADALLLDGAPAAALELYQQLLEVPQAPRAALLLKMADAYYLLGDLQAEQQLREAIYGSIEARGD